MGFDPSEMLEIFLSEAEEQLSVMDQALLTLEKRPDNRQAIDALFRAAHTVKASAAAQGFDDIASLSHAIESAMDVVRAGELEFTSDIADVLLGAVDALRIMLDAATSGEQPAVNIGELLERLQAIDSSNKGASPPEGEQGAPASHHAASERSGSDGEDSPETAGSEISGAHQPLDTSKIHRIALTPSQECLMPAARAWLWIQQISEWGRVLMTVPGVDELKAGELSTGKLIALVEADIEREAILEKAAALPEVGDVEVTEPRESDLREILGAGREEEGSTQPHAQIAPTVRVKVAHLEALMKLVGELVLCRARLIRQISKLDLDSNAQTGTNELRGVADELSSIVSELRDEVMRARLVPLENTFLRFSRVVRDAARREGKQVEFVIEGGETEVDRTIAESIVDPLKHLLRNAVSHGIETPAERQAAGKPPVGRIVLKAQHLDGNILITVSDDGRGIDPAAVRRAAVRKGIITPERAASLSDQEAIELLFLPGFSTKDQVT
ncbi:MAG: chemotaxis protein CheA, partial [Armatimonadetes bacterium]|nr:chemotaxis protein CheA [Armatimonadota bacterium]